MKIFVRERSDSNSKISVTKIFSDSAETHFAYTVGFRDRIFAVISRNISWIYANPSTRPMWIASRRARKNILPGCIEKERDSQWIILFAGPTWLAKKWAGLPRGCRSVRVSYSRTRRKEICEKETRKKRRAWKKDVQFARGKKREAKKSSIGFGYSRGEKGSRLI